MGAQLGEQVGKAWWLGKCVSSPEKCSSPRTQWSLTPLTATGFSDASLPACHGLRTPADLPMPRPHGWFVLASGTLLVPGGLMSFATKPPSPVSVCVVSPALHYGRGSPQRQIGRGLQGAVAGLRAAVDGRVGRWSYAMTP